MTDSKITVIRKVNNLTQSFSDYSDTTINSITSETHSSGSVSDSDEESEITSSNDPRSVQSLVSPQPHDKLKTSLEDILKKSDEKIKKQKDKKIKKSEKEKFYSLGISIIETSVLKFHKKIHKPRIRISLYDINSGKILTKKNCKEHYSKHHDINSTENEINTNFLTNPGLIMDSTSFSFRWPSNSSMAIFDEELDYLKFKNFIIFFELIDNSNTKSPNEWYHIAWSFLRSPENDELIKYKNKTIQMQLFKYQQKQSKFDSIFSEYTKRKRKNYSAILKILVNCKESNGISSASKSPTRTITVINKSNKDENSTDDIVDMHWQGILTKLQNRIFQIPEKQILQYCDMEKGCSVTSFSPDSSLLAFTELYRNFSVIVIFDIYKFEKKLELNGHEGIVHSLKWLKRGCENDGGKILLSSSEDQTCILWKILEKSYCIMNVLYHPTFVYSATFLEDNSFTSFNGIATGSRDGILRIWKINDTDDNFILKQEITNHQTYIIVVEFNERSNRLYSGEYSGIIIEWKLEKNNWILRRKLTTNKNPLKHFILCPILHRLYILTGSDLSTIELSSGFQYFPINGICVIDQPINLTISQCGDYIFIGFRRKLICWTAKLKTIIKEFHFNGNINSIDFNTEQNLLAIGTTGKYGGFFLYCPENYFSIKNITKKFQEIKHKDIFAMSTNSQFNLILNKFDNLFNFEWTDDNENDNSKIKTNRKNEISNNSVGSNEEEILKNQTFSVKLNRTFSISDKKLGKTFSINEISSESSENTSVVHKV